MVKAFAALTYPYFNPTRSPKARYHPVIFDPESLREQACLRALASNYSEPKGKSNLFIHTGNQCGYFLIPPSLFTLRDANFTRISQTCFVRLFTAPRLKTQILSPCSRLHFASSAN